MEEKESERMTCNSVLESYCQMMGEFAWEKAKEMVEKERDKSRSKRNAMTVTVSQLVSSMLTAFAQLALAEKNYMSLNLAPKGFFRKDVVKGMYESLKNEFERLSERGNLISSLPIQKQSVSPVIFAANAITNTITKNLRSSPTPSVSSNQSTTNDSPTKVLPLIDDKLSAHICGQLLHYIRARLDMIAIYERIIHISAQKFCVFDETVNSLTDIVKRNQNQFHHPILSAMKTGFTFECEILLCLLRSHIDIQHWRFVQSLFHLHDSHSKLNDWTASTVSRHSPNRGTVISRYQSLPPLCQWLCKLMLSLMSKYSLYFHSILIKQSSIDDMKLTCAKQSVDFYEKIIAFHKKMDAHCVCLIFDTNGEDDYRGSGYHSPYKPFEPPKGTDSYVSIFSYPIERPSNHMPSLIMIMNSKDKELNNTDSVVSFVDNHRNVTYFLSRPDPKITFIVIFESVKSDNHVQMFITEMCTHLKCNKIFASLKPGTK